MLRNILLACCIALLALVVGIKNIDFGSEKVSGEYIEEYLRSQDINFDVKPRAHISDAHIYNAAGFLYATGSSPTSYNFQHPPLIKYLFGFSSILFGSALFIQMVFAVLLPVITFAFGQAVFKSKIVPFAASVLLIADPLYRELSKHTLLDLGQAVFALSYVSVTLLLPRAPFLSGVFLGLFAASKFSSPALVFFAAVEIFLFLKNKRFETKRVFTVLASAFIVFSVTYAAAYVKTDGFNIIFWQLKIARFMLHHDVATQFGDTIVLFLTGNFNSWWNGEPSRDVWSLTWPVALVASAIMSLKNRKRNIKAFIYLFPVFYLLSLSTQAPFSRYFILVLPFFYLSLSFGIEKFLKNPLR